MKVQKKLIFLRVDPDMLPALAVSQAHKKGQHVLKGQWYKSFYFYSLLSTLHEATFWVCQNVTLSVNGLYFSYNKTGSIPGPFSPKKSP